MSAVENATVSAIKAEARVRCRGGGSKSFAGGAQPANRRPHRSLWQTSQGPHRAGSHHLGSKERRLPGGHRRRTKASVSREQKGELRVIALRYSKLYGYRCLVIGVVPNERKKYHE